MSTVAAELDDQPAEAFGDIGLGYLRDMEHAG